MVEFLKGMKFVKLLSIKELLKWDINIIEVIKHISEVGDFVCFIF